MWQVRPDYSPQWRQVRRSSRPRSPEQRPVRTALNSRSQPSSQELTLSFQPLAGPKPKTRPARLLLSIRKDAARSPGSARQGVPGRAEPRRSGSCIAEMSVNWLCSATGQRASNWLRSATTLPCTRWRPWLRAGIGFVPQPRFRGPGDGHGSGPGLASFRNHASVDPAAAMAPGSGRTCLNYVDLLAAGQLSDLSPGYPRFRTCLTVPLCPWIFSCNSIRA